MKVRQNPLTRRHAAEALLNILPRRPPEENPKHAEYFTPPGVCCFQSYQQACEMFSAVARVSSADKYQYLLGGVWIFLNKQPKFCKTSHPCCNRDRKSNLHCLQSHFPVSDAA
jgi:hypothetical protein